MNRNQKKAFWVTYIVFLIGGTIAICFYGVFNDISTVSLLILLAVYIFSAYALNKLIEKNPKRVLVGEFEGSKLTAENTWFGGAKLFHNNDIVATNSDLFSIKKNKPLLSARIIVNEVEHLVEVFADAIVTVKLQIKVNGEYIAGDKF